MSDILFINLADFYVKKDEIEINKIKDYITPLYDSILENIKNSSLKLNFINEYEKLLVTDFLVNFELFKKEEFYNIILLILDEIFIIIK